jgi:beta-phosphoglucomutase-like phosphatase (HAD superfamily)
VEPHLVRLGLRAIFEKVICGDDVAIGRTKPHPDVFAKALSELQISGNEALVLEDSPNGIKAARAAGITRVVAVPNPVTALLPMEGADLVLKSLSELPLEQLLKRVGDIGADRESTSQFATKTGSLRRDGAGGKPET